MTPSITRRDFLKAGSLLPLGLAAPGVLRTLSQPPAAGDTRQNVLVIIFDAWSAYHVPFSGYARQTTPNLSRLLDRAIVYHNHYAPADFTSPGTASLLTGTMPWTHRAFDLHGQVKESMVRQNIFRAFGDYHRAAYSHNPAANTLLRQFHQEGFVNQYVMTPSNSQGRIVFESEALENVPSGWKAREIYEIVSSDEFVETFEIAAGAGAYEVYSKARFKRDVPPSVP